MKMKEIYDLLYKEKRSKDEFKKLIQAMKKLLRRGYTLHIYRNSSPHNKWMESPKGRSSIHFAEEWFCPVFSKLRTFCRLQKSVGGKVSYGGFGKLVGARDEGMSVHSILEWNPDHDA